MDRVEQLSAWSYRIPFHLADFVVRAQFVFHKGGDSINLLIAAIGLFVGSSGLARNVPYLRK